MKKMKVCTSVWKRKVSLRVSYYLIAVLVSIGTAQAKTGHQQPDETLLFKKTDQGDLSLLMFYPPNYKKSDKVPAIVLFFGGGWMTGDNAIQMTAQAKYFASRGMVGICPMYRVEKTHGTMPKEALQDAKSAMRWIRSHAGELGIDPDRIVAGGGSAGGHLAAAVALAEGFNELGEDTSVSCVPQALVLFNPVFDNGQGGYGYDRVKEYWEAFSPMHNIDKDIPPSIVFFGTRDGYVPMTTAKEFKARVDAVGGRCELHLYEGQKHGVFNWWISEYHYALALQKTDKFLNSLGYLSGEPSIEIPEPEAKSTL